MKTKKLKYLFALFVMFVSLQGINAQNRFKVEDGIYIATYGNVTVIENDIKQQTIQIKVQKKSDNVYDIFCENKFVKSVAKTGIKMAIVAALKASGVASWVSPFAGVAADHAYDAVCNYFKDR